MTGLRLGFSASLLFVSATFGFSLLAAALFGDAMRLGFIVFAARFLLSAPLGLSESLRNPMTILLILSVVIDFVVIIYLIRGYRSVPRAA